MSKRIVICADGTWNRPEKNLEKDVPTNVLRLARAIKPLARDGVPQQVFYDWGIGSYHDRLSAGATGRGLHKNIMDDYRYIVQNYAPGDEIFLFGFSRGAYTIRSLCGMINNCGIVKRPEARLIQSAFEHYKRSSAPFKPSGPRSIAFRRTHSHASRTIKFAGVWDTVGAMGIPLSFLGFLEDKDEFYDTEIGSNVSIARHALAIDELRRDFEPTVWNPKPSVDMRQVWFVGAHSDIGGSHNPDPDGSLLSDLSLDWMTRQAGAAGLTFEPFLRQRLRGKATATLHPSRRKYYRLKKKFFRQIDHGKGPVLIHRSVKERWDADPSYRKRSKNLEQYLAVNGWPADLET
jgi:uncharacterized protein (DUF2235 family)